jgi:hypothetical protein
MITITKSLRCTQSYKDVQEDHHYEIMKMYTEL